MMNYTKIIKNISRVIFLIGIVLTIIFALRVTDKVYIESMDRSTMLDYYMWWGYALLFICIGLAVILPLPFMTMASYKRLGMTAVLFIVLFGISYMIANGDPVNAVVDVQPTESTLKMTDAGLKFTYILFAISLISIAFSSLYKSVILPRLTK